VTPSDTEIGGDGSRPLQRVVYAEGGVEVDGDGSRPLQRVVYAEGGVEVDGDGSAPFATEIKADGGGELGEAEGPFATEIKADGGGELGEAEGPFATEIKADGGVEIGAAADGAGTVLIGACSNPIKRTLWQTQPFTVNPADFPCWIDHARWLKLVYSDVTESWEGAAAFGACGRSWAVSIKWIGPGPDVWRVSVRWTPGPERSDEGPQTGLVCNPFSLTTVGFTVTGTDIGAEPAAGDLFFNLFIVDTPQP
jgi:hypothetical protein